MQRQGDVFLFLFFIFLSAASQCSNTPDGGIVPDVRWKLYLVFLPSDISISPMGCDLLKTNGMKACFGLCCYDEVHKTGEVTNHRDVEAGMCRSKGISRFSVS